jgi:hypothetical protein
MPAHELDQGAEGFKVGRGWARLRAAPARERRCRAGGAHVASRGAKQSEGSGTRERKRGSGEADGWDHPRSGLRLSVKERERKRRV